MVRRFVKYNNAKVTFDGIAFDSKKEAARYAELKTLQQDGAISGLELQKPYELIPAQYINGKCAERAVKYVADFVYQENGETVVEDTKGFKGGGGYAVFAIKRKLMLEKYGIRIKEG